VAGPGGTALAVRTINVETGMQAYAQTFDALGLARQWRRRGNENRLTYPLLIGFPGRSSGWDLADVTLEQLHPQPLLQQANLLATAPAVTCKLVGGLLEAEMAARPSKAAPVP